MGRVPLSMPDDRNHKKRGSRKTLDIPTDRRMSRTTHANKKGARSFKLRAPDVDP